MTIGPIFQNILSDKQVDSAEVVSLFGAMIELFPDLVSTGLRSIPGRCRQLLIPCCRLREIRAR